MFKPTEIYRNLYPTMSRWLGQRGLCPVSQDVINTAIYIVGSIMIGKGLEISIRDNGIVYGNCIYSGIFPRGKFCWVNRAGISWSDFLSTLTLPEELRAFAFEFLEDYYVHTVSGSN